MYNNIMVCSILRLIVYPSPLRLSMDKDQHQGLEANPAVKKCLNLGMKDKCCVNVKVYFEIVHVRIHVQPYPPFYLPLMPTTNPLNDHLDKLEICGLQYHPDLQ